MKTKSAFATGAWMIFSSALLQAAPWDHLPIPPPPHVVIERQFEERRARDYCEEQDYPRRGYRSDEYDESPSFWERTEVRAQVRLQRMGYYHGAIDGCFGYGSQRALMRFQLDRDLPVTGRLDRHSLRALRIY